MAKLFLRNAYEFENPSRRVFLAGELFEGSGAQAKKTKEWVNTKGESSPEAKALAEKVARQAEEIREGTKEDLLRLYVDLFTTGPIANKEVFNATTFKVDASYAKNGLLQTLEKNSAELRVTFRNTDDLRLLAYATVYKNFKNQGLDANYLPIGAEVTLVNGEVTVTYTENGVSKTATSELFPWSSSEIAEQKYAELMRKEAATKEAARGPRELGADDDAIGPTSSTPPTAPVAPAESNPAEVPTVLEVLGEEADYEKRLDTKVDKFRDDHGLTEKGLAPDGTRIGYNQMGGTATYNATLNKPDGSSVTINVRAEVADKADTEGLEKALEKALDEELAQLDKELDRTVPKETLLGNQWTLIETTLMDLQSTIPGTSIVVKDPLFDRTKYSKIIEVTNTNTGHTYNVEVTVPVIDRPSDYNDPRVKLRIREYSDDSNEYLDLNLLDPDNREVEYTGTNRIYKTVEHLASILSKKDPTDRVHIKKVAEATMDALFVNLVDAPDTWNQIDVQYKAMLASMPEGRIRALDHVRGAEAAWQLGNVAEARVRYEHAKRNVGDGSTERNQITENLNFLAKDYGPVVLNELVYKVLEPKNPNSPTGYQKRAVDYARIQLQTTGRFDGLLPLGSYLLGDRKTLTITREGATIQETPGA